MRCQDHFLRQQESPESAHQLNDFRTNQRSKTAKEDNVSGGKSLQIELSLVF